MATWAKNGTEVESQTQPGKAARFRKVARRGWKVQVFVVSAEAEGWEGTTFWLGESASIRLFHS